MEGSMKAEKIEAMKKNNKRVYFLYNFILYSLTSLITCLFFYSYPFNLFPSSMKHLILFYLENADFSDFINPKSLFVVANLIIFILIGESKLSSRYSSPASDVYDEYIRRNRSRLKLNSSDESVIIKEEEEEGDGHVSMQSVKLSEDKKKHGNIIKKREIRVCRSRQYYQKEKKSSGGGMRVSKSEVWGESEIAKMEKTMEERESIIPKEELDQRVEDFIARVNKQRLLEAKLEQLIM
ncbi:hypothetical protein ACP275_13G152100 [Erythranthe tilingii]